MPETGGHDDDEPTDDAAEEDPDPLLVLEVGQIVKNARPRKQVDNLQAALAEFEIRAQVARETAVRWRSIGQDRRGILMADEADRLVAIPPDLMDVIVNRKPFEGTVDPQGGDLVYTHPRGKVTVPRALVFQLQEEGERVDR